MNLSFPKRCILKFNLVFTKDSFLLNKQDTFDLSFTHIP